MSEAGRWQSADLPTRYVVDASVGVKLFVAEPFSQQTGTLIGQPSRDSPAGIYVPDLSYGECANLLWKHVRRCEHPAEVARQNLIDLRALALRRISTAGLVSDVPEIALAYDVNVYDGGYVALAKSLRLPLVTAD